MAKPFSCKIAIANTCTAISNVSRTWEDCWQAFCRGDAIFSSGDDVYPRWPETPPLSKIGERGGWKEQPPFLFRYSTLMRTVGEDMRGLLDDLENRHKGIRIQAIIATCHSDPGPLSVLVDGFSGVTDSIPDVAWERVQKMPFPTYLHEGIGRNIPTSMVSSACASALVATSYGADLIDAGVCDAVLIVALDGLARVAAAGFLNIGAMAKPLCMPYDVNRNGTTVGEGGVGYMLVNEKFLNPDQVYGHVTGTSIYCDAAHIVEPNLEGVRSVLQQALDQAEVETAGVAGIYWHGTGTKHNDKVEAEVSELMFGNSPPPSTSTKGNLGHTMGASGGYNVLAACETNKSGKMVHVCTLKELEYPNLDIVMGEPRQIQPGPMLITALGFGGINAAVVVTP